MSLQSTTPWKAAILYILCLSSLYTLWMYQSHLAITSCDYSASSKVTTSLQQEQQQEQQQQAPHPQSSYPIPYPHVMGLVHMAKTGGSHINSYLAAHFERVCGNKGNSYDSSSFHQRIQTIIQKQVAQNQTPCTQITCKAFQDSMSKLASPRGAYKVNRGHVPFEVLKEIGYEDCDYISMEINAKEWNNIANRLAKSPMRVTMLANSGNWTDRGHQVVTTAEDSPAMLYNATADTRNNIPKERLELHVPCRDPVDHILSQCNDRQMEFHCNDTTGRNDNDLWWQELVDDCIIDMSRFRLDRWKNTSTQMDIHVHCFDNGALPAYLELMSQRLQPRRRTPTFVSPKTNKDRQKDKECLRHDILLQAKVKDYLLEEYPYYRWCQQCLGGPDDLLVGRELS